MSEEKRIRNVIYPMMQFCDGQYVDKEIDEGHDCQTNQEAIEYLEENEGYDIIREGEGGCCCSYSKTADTSYDELIEHYVTVTLCKEDLEYMIEDLRKDYPDRSYHIVHDEEFDHYYIEKGKRKMTWNELMETVEKEMINSGIDPNEEIYTINTIGYPEDKSIRVAKLDNGEIYVE